MKLASIGVIVAALALGACATGGSARSHAVAPQHVDSQKMRAVEHAALAHGVDVIWINPPMTR